MLLGEDLFGRGMPATGQRNSATQVTARQSYTRSLNCEWPDRGAPRSGGQLHANRLGPPDRGVTTTIYAPEGPLRGMHTTAVIEGCNLKHAKLARQASTPS